jgi:hypothetical protein
VHAAGPDDGIETGVCISDPFTPISSINIASAVPDKGSPRLVTLNAMMLPEKKPEAGSAVMKHNSDVTKALRGAERRIYKTRTHANQKSASTRTITKIPCCKKMPQSNAFVKRKSQILNWESGERNLGSSILSLCLIRREDLDSQSWGRVPLADASE